MQQLIKEDQHTQRVLHHFIGDVRGDHPGPTVVAVAGVHGNEATGIAAVERVIDLLEPLKEHIHGRFVGLKGNLAALDQNVRYVDEDMNRLWVTSMLDKIRRTSFEDIASVDRVEVKELLEILDPIVYSEDDEKVVYVDLHTFSGSGGMFSITPREERHIELLTQLKVPLVFGIQHTLIGTSMEYVEDAGHVGFAFETGTHGTKDAEDNAYAGLLILLVSSGVIPASKLDGFGKYYEYLNEKVEELPHKVDFHYKHIIEEGDEFVMNPGFRNFDKVKKGDWLATDRHGKITAQSDGYILMPLYQAQGNDGFFIVRDCE
jgi:succinylglutamate desuccinylase